MKVWRAEACPDYAKHTACPRGYVAWSEWALRIFRTHYQVQCPTCDLWTIWKRRETPLTAAQAEALLLPVLAIREPTASETSERGERP